ncbi:MAG: hypothetical protein ACPGFA_06650 [Pikeienuella sp.]
MLKIVAAAAFALSVFATPLLADDAKPVGFGTTAENALGYLTLSKTPRPLTRDAQLNQGIYADVMPLRTTAQSQRSRVFSQNNTAATRTLNGRRGFERIDR